MEDDSEQGRQIYEKRILIAIIAGPLLLWFFRSGHFLTVIGFLLVATQIFCTSTVDVLAEMFFALALLSVWRHPFAQQSVWRTLLLYCLAVAFGAAGRTIVLSIFLYPDFYWIYFDTYEVMSRTLFLVLCLAIFVLVRRFTGACLIADDVATIPHRSPLSIAELMYWTGLVAVICMTASHLWDFNDRFFAVAPTHAPICLLLLNLAACIGPILIFTTVPGSFWVRLSLAAGCFTVARLSQQLLLVWSMAIPFQFSAFSLATEVFFHVTGVALAVGWSFLRGDQYIRLKRRSDA